MVYEAGNSVAMIDNRSFYQLDKMEDVYLVLIFLNSQTNMSLFKNA